VKRIPARPDMGHLKKQAKQLLAAYRSGSAQAMESLRSHLPAAKGLADEALAAMDLRLHDAQSCVAREHGFASWSDLSGYVQACQRQSADPEQSRRHWLALVYAGDVAGGTHRAQPALARRLLAERPGLAGDDPYVACATGDLAALRRAAQGDPGWLQRPGGPLGLPPLVAVTHSSLLRLPEFAGPLRACARWLLEAGADPQQSIGNRWPPASLQAPSDTERLSALYGAAGQNHDAPLTQMLLQAGADPNDGESLYHSLEGTPASRECTRLLLQAGARVDGCNALFRVLDLDDVQALRLLLDHGADPNESNGQGEWGRPLLWAIRRGRSTAHIQALLDAGADPATRTPQGLSAAALARRFGLADVAALLEQAAGSESATPEERFVAACARDDKVQAGGLLASHPALLQGLSPEQLRMLPELAALGRMDAVRCMVELGWPIAARGGDWDASALNQAVFRGDAAMSRFLLEHGAQWTERHAYGDNCAGSLCWASLNQPESTEPGGGDWLGCAQALIDHGMPLARPDPEAPGCVLIDGNRQRYPDEITDLLLGVAPD
jgi:ankyrin repeat protein